MTTMQQLAPQQASPEVPINENFASLSAMALFGQRHAATSGLSWAYYGGIWGGVTVADGQVTLSGSASNYVTVARAGAAVSVSTSAAAWNDTATNARIAKIMTSTSGVIGIEDHRAGAYGALGGYSPPPAATVASAATLTLPQGVRVVNVTGTTGVSSIDAAGHDGAVVVLVFAAALTVTDGSNLRLAGNFTSTADDTLTVACVGANWYEVARSVN